MESGFDKIHYVQAQNCCALVLIFIDLGADPFFFVVFFFVYSFLLCFLCFAFLLNRFTKAMEEQSTLPWDQESVKYGAYALMGLGALLVLSSTWALGWTNTFLGGLFFLHVPMINRMHTHNRVLWEIQR